MSCALWHETISNLLGAASTSGEVDAGYLLEADVDWGLVDEDEASLERVQEPGGCLVRTADRWSSRVAATKHATA